MKVPQRSQRLVIDLIPLFLTPLALWLYANYNFVITKTHAKEIAHVVPARRSSSAQASSSSGTPKPLAFLDITTVSEEERSIGETDGDKAAGEGMAAEESRNTSANSDPRTGGHPQSSLGKDTEDEDSGKELSIKDDSKAAKDVDLDEVKGFLNDDVQVEAEDTKVCFPVFC